FTYVGGGPGSGMYKTTDGGKTWKKINTGLPEVMGRIGLVISPADPEKIYAMVEAEGGGGFYRSTTRGARWEKRSGYSTSGNYYSEIVAHPTLPDVVYAMDTWMHVTTDGGKTFTQVNENRKHVDNHAMWIDPDDPDYFLVGCDGGIYESFDAANSWHFKDNLPVTQFYKVAVDNSKPFYYVYGGTQDNFSLGGPSRTRNQHGIVNADWFVTQGGDGFESAIDPENPNIVYAQYQYGGLTRYDRATGENMGIQPKPREGEPAYRWNWDAPLQTSAHKSGRIYYAANKVFRSDDYGNTWTVISPDLTRQIDRNALPVMGRVQSIDAVAKNASTSQYGTIVSFSESPLNENLLYAGTDDGLIQITEDGGQTWRKVAQFPGVPDQTFVYMLLAGQHDENVVYACFNNHRNGDFKPYIYKSSDKGHTWTNISANLPERGSTYCVAEDHVKPGLIFTGTEFGCYVSVDDGGHWKKLAAGLPTVAVRDMAIQKRENDLVIATFGRGFYVLDDYSPLREMTLENLAGEARIFSVKDGLVFVERTPLGIRGKGFLGDSYFTAENPPVGATFTFYRKTKYKTLKERRQAAEKALIKEGKDVRYPTYEALKAEQEEEAPFIELTIQDAAGNIIRKLKTGQQNGVQRIVWDGRLPDYRPVSLRPPGDNIFGNPQTGIPALPGKYTVRLAESINGQMTELAGPVSFELKLLEGATLPAKDNAQALAFQAEAAELQGKFSGLGNQIGEMDNELKHIRAAIHQMTAPTPALYERLRKIENELSDIRRVLYGDPLQSKLDLPETYPVAARIGYILAEIWGSTSDPTNTQREGLRIAKKEFEPQLERFNRLRDTDLKALEQQLNELGAPYTPGRRIE
ncbi:MAG: glycosyl hydrolase, partial [Bacteroidetes bacterium]